MTKYQIFSPNGQKTCIIEASSIVHTPEFSVLYGKWIPEINRIEPICTLFKGYLAVPLENLSTPKKAYIFYDCNIPEDREPEFILLIDSSDDPIYNQILSEILDQDELTYKIRHEMRYSDAPQSISRISRLTRELNSRNINYEIIDVIEEETRYNWEPVHK